MFNEDQGTTDPEQHTDEVGNADPGEEVTPTETELADGGTEDDSPGPDAVDPDEAEDVNDPNVQEEAIDDAGNEG